MLDRGSSLYGSGGYDQPGTRLKVCKVDRVHRTVSGEWCTIIVSYGARAHVVISTWVGNVVV